MKGAVKPFKQTQQQQQLWKPPSVQSYLGRAHELAYKLPGGPGEQLLN